MSPQTWFSYNWRYDKVSLKIPVDVSTSGRNHVDFNFDHIYYDKGYKSLANKQQMFNELHWKEESNKSSIAFYCYSVMKSGGLVSEASSFETEAELF